MKMHSNSILKHANGLISISGLVGPLITCKRGSLQDNGIPRGYAAEKFLLVAVMDENKSRYLDRNMERFCTSPKCANVAKGIKDLLPFEIIYYM